MSREGGVARRVLVSYPSPVRHPRWRRHPRFRGNDGQSFRDDGQLSMKIIRVAVGVICNAQQQVFITQRPPGTDLAGCWEFPGGKCESDESIEDTLARELLEEIGIGVTHFQHLIDIEHQYDHKHIYLSVFLISEYDGVPSGCEGQNYRWVRIDDLENYTFPRANDVIIEKLLLL